MIAAYEYNFITGASELLALVENKYRLYILHKPVEYEVRFDSGILHVRTEAGFEFDGRSGPAIIDWFAPNLGSIYEKVAWHMHDALGYAQSLSFANTNYALKYFLRDIVGYSKFKSELIRKAVSLSSDWYGVPMPNDRWFVNVDKVDTRWYEI